MSKYMDKYRCVDCDRSYWSIGHPMECSHCGGTVKLEIVSEYPADNSNTFNTQKEETGLTPLTAETIGFEISEFRDGFEEWRDSLGKEDGDSTV